MASQYADFATKLAAADAAAAALMVNVRAAKRYPNRHHRLYSSRACQRRRSAQELHPLGFESAWMPKPETMRRLEKLIVRVEAKRQGETFHGETAKRGYPGTA
jgi:hypothetical protein